MLYVATYIPSPLLVLNARVLTLRHHVAKKTQHRQHVTHIAVLRGEDGTRHGLLSIGPFWYSQIPRAIYTFLLTIQIIFNVNN